MRYKNIYTTFIEEINKLKEEIVENDLTSNCFLAELSFTKSSIEDFSEFNDWLKENYEEEEYKKMYEWMDLAEFLEDEEEDE